MNAIDEYLKAKEHLKRFRSWRSLIGKEYFGGTRGKGGEYGKIVKAECVLEIYYQEFDGATNYHRSNEKTSSKLAAAVIKNSQLLLDDVEKMLLEDVELARIEASKIAKEILEN